MRGEGKGKGESSYESIVKCYLIQALKVQPSARTRKGEAGGLPMLQFPGEKRTFDAFLLYQPLLAPWVIVEPEDRGCPT